MSSIPHKPHHLFETPLSPLYLAAFLPPFLPGWRRSKRLYSISPTQISISHGNSGGVPQHSKTHKPITPSSCFNISVPLLSDAVVLPLKTTISEEQILCAIRSVAHTLSPQQRIQFATCAMFSMFSGKPYYSALPHPLPDCQLPTYATMQKVYGALHDIDYTDILATFVQRLRTLTNLPVKLAYHASSSFPAIQIDNTFEVLPHPTDPQTLLIQFCSNPLEYQSQLTNLHNDLNLLASLRNTLSAHYTVI